MKKRHQWRQRKVAAASSTAETRRIGVAACRQRGIMATAAISAENMKRRMKKQRRRLAIWHHGKRKQTARKIVSGENVVALGSK